MTREAPGGLPGLAARLLTGCLLVAVAALSQARSAGAEGSAPADVRAGKDPGSTYAGTPDALVPYRRQRAPYRALYTTPPLFRGPGRERPEPAGVESVLLGVLTPLEGSPDEPIGRSLLHGVELAIEEANRGGGYRGLPFRLAVRNDRPLWGSSATSLVDLAYREGVWAVIGSPDSNSTHVALRAAFKAEVPIVNVGGTDPTLTETGIPWIVRCTPDDRQSGYVLAELLFEREGFERVAVIRSTDRYGRLGVAEFRDAARRLGRPVPMEMLVAPDQRDFTSEIERLEKDPPGAVVLWTKGAEAGRLVRALRRAGLSQPVFGTSRMDGPQFFAAAGEAAEGVRAALWIDRGSAAPAWQGFRSRFAARFGDEPDAFAAYGYEAARMVVAAVRTAGLNRARIRDALAAMRAWQGVVGELRFDPTSNNVSRPLVARVEGGRFVAR